MLQRQELRKVGLKVTLPRLKILEILEHSELRHLSAEAQRIAKIRRQKRKRSKRAKEKLLRVKYLRAGKKALRSAVGPSDID